MLIAVNFSKAEPGRFAVGDCRIVADLETGDAAAMLEYADDGTWLVLPPHGIAVLGE